MLPIHEHFRRTRETSMAALRESLKDPVQRALMERQFPDLLRHLLGPHRPPDDYERRVMEQDRPCAP